MKKITVSMMLLIVLCFSLIVTNQKKLTISQLSEDILVNSENTNNLRINAVLRGNHFSNDGISYSNTSSIFSGPFRMTAASFTASPEGHISDMSTEASSFTGFRRLKRSDNGTLHDYQHISNESLPDGGFEVILSAHNTSVPAHQRFFGIYVNRINGSIMMSKTVRIIIELVEGSGTLTFDVRNGTNFGNASTSISNPITLTQGINVLDYVFTPTTPNHAIHAFVRSANDGQVRFKIHKYEAYWTDEYKAQNEINRFLDSSYTGVYLYHPISDLTNAITSINNTLTTEAWSTDGRPYITAQKDEMQILSDAVKPLYDLEASFYTDSTLTTIKSSVTSQEVANFESAVNAISNANYINYKNNLLSRAATLRFNQSVSSNKRAYISELTTRVASYRTFIDGLVNATETRKTELKNQMDTYATTKRNDINSRTTLAQLEADRTAFTSQINTSSLSEGRNNYNPIVVLRRDNAISQIDANTTLTDQDKTSYKNSITQNYNTYRSTSESASTGQEVKTGHDTFMSSITTLLNDSNRTGNQNIASSRSTAKDELIRIHDLNLVPEVNAMNLLSQTEKDRYLSEALAILNAGLSQLDASTEFADINNIRATKVNELVSKHNEARLDYRKLVEKDNIQVKVNGTLNTIANLTYLGDQAESFRARLLSAQTNANQAMDTATSTQIVIDISADYTFKESEIILDATRTNATERVLFMKNQVEALFSGLDLVDETSFSNARTSLENTYQSSIGEINNAQLTQVDTIINSVGITMNNVLAVLRAKQNALLEINTLANARPSDQVTAILNDSRSSILSEITLETVATKLSEAKVNILERQRIDAVESYTTILNTYATESKSTMVDDIISSNRTRMNDTTTLDDALAVITDVETRILAQTRLEAYTSIENLIAVTDRKNTMVTVIENLKSMISDALNPEEIKDILAEAFETVLSQFKAENNLLLENISGNNRSARTNELLDQATQRVDEATSIEAVKALYAELSPSLQRARNIDLNVQSLADFHQNQLESHVLSEVRRQEVLDTYETINGLVASGDLTFAEARERLLTKILEVADVSYRITNGNFDILDDNLSYPENAGNQVFAGISNSLGLRAGTTMQISRAEILVTTQTRLKEKFENGNITVPTDSQLTVRQIVEKLSGMTYIRQLEINLLSGTNQSITNFEGIYQVSLLIPDEYRNYAEFLVVFETANGAEVFKTYRSNAWLTFETPHFSTFYVLGSEEAVATETTEEMSLGMIVIILAGLNLLVLVIIMVLEAFKTKKTNKAYVVVLPLMILAFNIEVLIIFTSVSLIIYGLSKLLKKEIK